MIKINMGCGWRNFGKDWVHIDGGDYNHLDYKDITDLSQFNNNTVDLIYASHILEYFDRQQISSLLAEWRRVLKSGGTLRIAVPDFSKVSILYNSGEYGLDNFLGPLYGRMKMEDKTIYHKTVYDFESIKKLLENNNFKDVVRYEWRNTSHAQFDDHSQAYLPHMDKDNGTLISLNVECKK